MKTLALDGRLAVPKCTQEREQNDCCIKEFCRRYVFERRSRKAAASCENAALERTWRPHVEAIEEAAPRLLLLLLCTLF